LPDPVLIADIRCGTGRFSHVLADTFDARAVGIEPSAEMLGQASPHPTVEYRRGLSYHGACVVAFATSRFRADPRRVMGLLPGWLKEAVGPDGSETVPREAGMAEHDHQELRRLFDLAIATPLGLRGALLDRECGGDAGLRRRVEAMVTAAEEERLRAPPTADQPSRPYSDADPTLDTPSPSRAAFAPPGEGPGTRIGLYKLLHLLGEGGFGSVFMAEQEKPVSRKVALKIIKLGMDTRQVVARFEQERQALALMDHPNIARVLDAGATEAGRPYFVMDLVKGDPIVEYCDKNSLSIPERLELFAQVCHAVQHAHTKGIIHRDIKPSNILVSTQDGRPNVKVIDFGIAKATASRLTEKTLFTEHKQLIGTPEYMSPEQAEGSLDIDTRTDVYSLGVLLYELLTGSTPFGTKDLRSAAYAEMQRIIREVEPPKPSTRLSQNTDTIVTVAAKRHTEPKRLGTIVRGELDWIVMKALEKDRSRRYDTASGLAADIGRYLSGETVVAAPPGAAYRFKKFVRRHRGPVAAGGAVAAALLLGMIGFAWQAKAARAQRDLAVVAQRAEAEQRRTADEQRDRAVAAEAETTKRAQELAQVSDFQSKMLSQIDANDAGIRLMDDIREKFDAALEKSGVPETERAGRAEVFGQELGLVNATDAAAEMIGRTILEPSIKAINAEFKDQPAVDATLRHALADLYRILGRYDDAVSLQASALATRRRVLGDDDPATLDSLGNLATFLDSQGKPAEAETLYREALERRQRVYGEGHPETMAVMGNLGTLLRAQGKFDEAEPLLRARLEGARRVDGPEHRSTLIALNTYGFLLIDQGKLAEAEPYWREAYETGKRVFGPDDPDVFVWTNNLGGLLSAQGHLRDAEPYFRAAYETSRRIRGEEHPQTLACLRGVGNILKRQGRYAEAEPFFREALEKRRRVLGEEHPDTLRSIGEMGSLLQAQGKLDEAEPYYRERLDKCERTLGQEHPDTLNAFGSMALLLRAQGRAAEAERFDRESMETRRRLFGDDHPDTLISASNVCIVLMDQDKLAEAEALCRDVLERRGRVLGPEHPDTLVSNSIMSLVLTRQQKLDEAEPYIRFAMDSGRRVLGEDHPDTLIFTINLGTLLREQGRLSESEAILREAMHKGERVLGTEHQTTLTATVHLGGALAMQDRYVETQELLVPVEPPARQAFRGANASTLASLLTHLGRARAGLGEFAAAEAGLLEAHPVFLKTRGQTHKSTRDCAQALIDLYTTWNETEPGHGYDAKAAQWTATRDGAK
jgi:eukaryotic-like serine/threonine-protein kinase